MYKFNYACILYHITFVSSFPNTWNMDLGNPTKKVKQRQKRKLASILHIYWQDYVTMYVNVIHVYITVMQT